MAPLPGSPNRTFDAIEKLAGAGLPAQELLQQVALQIEQVVPSDGSFVAATDPDTTLSIGAGLVRDLPRSSASRPGTTSSSSPTT